MRKTVVQYESPRMRLYSAADPKKRTILEGTLEECRAHRDKLQSDPHKKNPTLIITEA